MLESPPAVERAVLRSCGPLTSDCPTEPEEESGGAEVGGATGTLEIGLGSTNGTVEVSGSDAMGATDCEGTSGTRSHNSSSLREVRSKSAGTGGSGPCGQGAGPTCAFNMSR